MTQENSVMVSLREVRGIQENRVRDEAQEREHLRREAARLQALQEQQERDARLQKESLAKERKRLEAIEHQAREGLLRNLEHALLRIDALETRRDVAQTPPPRRALLLPIALTACTVVVGLFFVSQQKAAVGRDLARLELAAQETEAHIDNLTTSLNKVETDSQLTQGKLAALGRRQATPPAPRTERVKPRGRKKPPAKPNTDGPDCDRKDPICGANKT